jgi:phosphoribosyl-ATP pyrophosphohydrolase/phosphoribosyl-AMP cyclohydrolase
VIDLSLDCDGDALLVRVEALGPACHTGQRTCVHRPATDGAEAGGLESPIAPPSEQEVSRHGGQVSLVNLPALEMGLRLQELFALIQERRAERPPNSYTTYLFESGLDKILKKVGEEAAETIIAAKNEGTKELSAEITDLLYHLLVLMAEREVSLGEIAAELNQRAGRPADPRSSAREGRPT